LAGSVELFESPIFTPSPRLLAYPCAAHYSLIYLFAIVRLFVKNSDSDQLS